MQKIKAAIGGPKDNVGIALMDLEAGSVLELKAGERNVTVKLMEPVTYQHKFSIAPMVPEEDVVKYGEVIGKATKQIDPGQHVHIHNMIGLRLGAAVRKEERK
jgi:altronate dehydratase small subunit